MVLACYQLSIYLVHHVRRLLVYDLMSADWANWRVRSYKNVLYDLNTVTLLNKNSNIRALLSSGRDT
jgi:hypothetical protein